MHVRIARVPSEKEINALLKRGSLLQRSERPESDVASFGQLVTEEVLQPTTRLVERITLHVEEDIARRGRRHEREPFSLLER
jgi:hypothetical protein